MDWTVCQNYFLQKLTHMKTAYLVFCSVLKYFLCDNFVTLHLINF
jgi:hypothetical protein